MWWPMCVKQAHYCTALLNKTYLFTIWKGKKKNSKKPTKRAPNALLLIIFLFVQPEARSSSCGFVEGKVHARKGDGATESSQPGKHTATNIKPTVPKFQLVSLYWYFDLWFMFNSEVDFSEEAAWRTAQLSILYHMRTRSLMAAFEMELKTEQNLCAKKSSWNNATKIVRAVCRRHLLSTMVEHIYLHSEAVWSWAVRFYFLCCFLKVAVGWHHLCLYILMEIIDPL